MTILDTSHYIKNEVIDNYLIEVLPVNKSKWVTFMPNKNFNLVLNSSNLGYKRVGEDVDLIDLPDGIYEIKQSYKPNSVTLSHFLHMRTNALNLKYMELLCKHFDSKCEKEKREYNQETQYLIRLKQYIDSSEYSVTEKHDKTAGIKFYNEAVELIKRIENECRCL